jgi:hypothetical protein
LSESKLVWHVKWGEILLLLLDGITGFNRNEADGRKPTVDSFVFKNLCYTVANHVGGQVISLSGLHGTNFYQAEVHLGSERIYILLNGAYPFFAFASKLEYLNIHFIDQPALSKEIAAFNEDYRVLTTSELHEPLHPDVRKQTLRNENTLNKNDLQDIFYWKSQTVGEIIYNYWD